jgi:hypothetical protein
MNRISVRWINCGTRWCSNLHRGVSLYTWTYVREPRRAKQP